jgi:hypothetical protein
VCVCVCVLPRVWMRKDEHHLPLATAIVRHLLRLPNSLRLERMLGQ